MQPTHYAIEQLTVKDLQSFRELMDVFSEAFEDHQKDHASEFYLTELLSKPEFVVLVIRHNSNVVGGLAGYELMKYRCEESEFFIYDLAVAEAHRRQGLATRLIQRLQEIMHERGVSSIFVDASAEDKHAVALYESLQGRSEPVVQFTYVS